MAESVAGEVTVILQAVRDGESGARERLFDLVYRELKAIALRRAGVMGPLNLQATELVSEAYLRMFARDGVSFENRHHLYWAAARAMRSILIDHVRAAKAQKRGGGCRVLPLNDEMAVEVSADRFLELDEALERLEREHEGVARVVMLRFFAGLTREQIAEITGASASSVWRDWQFARAWLLDVLGDGAR